MTTALAGLRERLRASLWLVPAITTAVAFGGAKTLVLLDRALDQGRKAWFLFGGEADSARELLSTIASSVMTFAGLVFSITILSLQLASNQFSPRVLRTFLEDRESKAAMAAFVGAFVYAMALLPEVRSGGDDGGMFVPALSIFVAFVLVLLSVGVFIHYIHHMAHSLRVISIVKRIAAETRRTVDSMYPDELAGDEAGAEEEPRPEQDRPPALVVNNEGEPGVLSHVDQKTLLRVARESRAVVGVVPMPGDFVPRGSPLFRLWREAPSAALPPKAIARLREALLIEDERTPKQDPAFGIRQLVDIAERALSPGINDPTTAVQALDEIHDLLRTLSRRRFPSSARRDEDGTTRLILPRPGWSAYVHLGLDEIRHYGAGSIQVARRMRALIEDCLVTAPASRRACLEEQRRLLEEATSRELPEAERALVRDPLSRGGA